MMILCFIQRRKKKLDGTNGIMCVINFRVVMGKPKTNGVGAYFATPLPLYIYL